jgi:hypothetical protein
MTERFWRLPTETASPDDFFTATLKAEAWEARVDVRHPQRGIHFLRTADANFPSTILLAAQIAPGNEALEVADHYIRGVDLVATYVQRTRDAVRPQIYWRLLGAGKTAPQPSSAPPGWELIVSVQTSLLHSEPACTVLSEVAGEEAWRMSDDERGEFVRVEGGRGGDVVCTREDGTGVFLVRTSDPRFSYLQMVYPSDFHRTTVTIPGSPGASVRVAHQLFPEALEKGVIRR